MKSLPAGWKASEFSEKQRDWCPVSAAKLIEENETAVHPSRMWQHHTKRFAEPLSHSECPWSIGTNFIQRSGCWKGRDPIDEAQPFAIMYCNAASYSISLIFNHHDLIFFLRSVPMNCHNNEIHGCVRMCWTHFWSCNVNQSCIGWSTDRWPLSPPSNFGKVVEYFAALL